MVNGGRWSWGRVGGWGFREKKEGRFCCGE